MTSITSTAATATSSTPTIDPNAPATPGLAKDFNTFLKLLTTQLQNQDPLSPLDTNQMTQQLVSFSQVEQAINANTKLANLVKLQSTDQTITALPLVGHTIQYNDLKAPLAGGEAKFGYSLPGNATNTVLTVSDANGHIVYQGLGEKSAGDHIFTWNGKGSDGSQLPDGVYSLSVAATGPDKATLQATITAYGKINQVQVDNGTPSLNIGGVVETLDKILAITDAAT
jgi:flagellar basal-body rod modification protein FlgD